MTPEQLVRFWARVEQGEADACWLWKGAHNMEGYAIFYLSRRGGREERRRVSRVMVEVMGQPVPDALIVLHSCDNPPCVNPAHLSVGTHADNAADRNRKHRQARGERHGMVIAARARRVA